MLSLLEVSMHKLALIGKNLSHSKSKEIYQHLLGSKIEYTYLEYENADSLPDLDILLGKFHGISITAPYKNDIYKLVKTSSEIRSLKAVNCIKMLNNEIVGTNTDYLASLEIIKTYDIKKSELVLIIGDGSMSNVIQHVCNESGVDFHVTSRKIDKLTLLKKNIFKYSLIINTCSREFDFSSVKYIKNQKLWDLNYDQSYFVGIKDKYKNLYKDGKELLELQAKFACKYWEIY